MNISILLLIIIAIFPPLSMYILSLLIDLIYSSVSVNQIIQIIILYFFSLVASNFLPLINLLGSYLWITAETALQETIINKVDNLNAKYFDCEEYYSSLELAKSSYTDAIGTTMMLISAICISIISVIFISSYLATISWIIPFTLASILCFKIIIYKYMGICTLRANELVSEQIKDCRLLSSYLITKDTIVFGAQTYFLEKWKSTAHLLKKHLEKVERKNIILSAVFDLFLYILYVVMLVIIIIHQIQTNTVAISEIVLLITSADFIYTNLDKAITQIGNVYTSKAISKSLFDFLDLSSEPPITHHISPGNTITVKNLSYRYPTRNKYALHNVSLSIHAGETIAVVGKNGSGKSTFIKLLAGLYLPTSGELTYGSRFHLSPNTSQNLSAVFQDYSIYLTSIRENILLGFNKNLTTDVEKILKEISNNSWYQELPNGIDTKIGVEFGGIDLSGGEKQQIAIARSFYRDHTIIFLDEPTSAIDPILEDRINNLFINRAEGSTAIITTHRLTSTRFADRILVFDNGTIVEQGTHSQLMHQKGLYYQLYLLQGKYYYARD